MLVEEVLSALAVRPTGFYVDATFGRGGHSARILSALDSEGRLLAIDRDPQAVRAGRLRFAQERRLRLVQGDFAHLAALVHEHGARAQCDGILLDLGVSSPQLEDAQRGFSFQRDGPLDMRMDPTRGEPLSVWLAHAPVAEIARVIATLGEERYARRIAAAIERARRRAPVTRSGELAALVAGAVPTRERGRHPATRTFQALRMMINDELGQLQAALPQALELLADGGRLVCLSFHSLEDRMVKEFLRTHSQPDPLLAGLPSAPTPPLRLIGRKRRASAAEIAANPRARSAVLRVAERVRGAARRGPGAQA